MRIARAWSVPAAVAALVAAAAGLSAATASAEVDLPDRTAEQVLVLAQQSREDSFSGTVEVRAHLGLPELPRRDQGVHGRPDAGPLELLMGGSVLRVWVDGPERQRVQWLQEYAETDVARDGRDVWTYDSREDAYRHLVLPEHRGGAAHGDAAGPLPAELTPQALAERFLALVEPTTVVTVGQDAEVAGRGAYELRLEPRDDPDTLIGRVALAVDAETGLVLRASVTGRGEAEPSLLVGFTSLDLDTPPAERFRLAPPEGADVEELRPPVRHPEAAHRPRSHEQQHAAQPPVTGSGWSMVLELPAGQVPPSPQLDALTRRVDGGRLLRTDLLTALLTDDGRLLVGAVTPEALQRAAR